MASRSHVRLVALILALGLVSCGGSSDSGQPDVRWSFDAVDTAQPDVPADDVGTTGKDIITVPDGEEPKYELFFMHEPGQAITVSINSFLTLTVKVIDYASAGLAVDYPVTFTLEPDPEDLNPPAGQTPAELTTFIALTNEKGEARVTFKSNTMVGQEYLVTAWGDYALPAQQKVYVTDVPTGDLKVVLKNGTTDPSTGTAAYNFNNIRVTLFQGSVCDNLSPVHEPYGYLQDFSVVSMSNPVNFNHLPVEGVTYTVFATALGANGHLAGSGCVEDIILQPDTVNTRNLEINLLNLNPTGCYDAVNEFDFTDAIPGQVGEIIGLMVDLFYDPGTFIFDMTMKIIKMYFGEIWGTIAETIINPFKNYLANLITDWFLNNSPDWVQCFFVVGQDLTQIIARAELIGDVCLYKASGGQVNGEEQWHGININWALGCQQVGPCKGVSFNPLQDLCGYDPAKDKCVCPIDLTQLGEFPGDFVAGYFSGVIGSFDKLVISPHEVQINYGKLILWVLNDLIIKYVTNGQYNSIEGLLKSIIDCHSIAYGMIGDLLDAIGISNGQLESFCDGAVSFLISPLEEVIGALHFDTSLWLNGGATMLDQNDDLIVDKLINGFWLGSMQIDGATGSQFEGTFHATRKGLQP